MHRERAVGAPRQWHLPGDLRRSGAKSHAVDKAIRRLTACASKRGIRRQSQFAIEQLSASQDAGCPNVRTPQSTKNWGTSSEKVPQQVALKY